MIALRTQNPHSMTNTQKPPPKPDKPKAPQTTKQERLAEALRQNLLRRKAVTPPKKSD